MQRREHEETRSHKGDPHTGPSASPPQPEAVFWRAGSGLDDIPVRIEPPDPPLQLLEQLGSSPFPRGGFPVIGFLATTYEKVSRFALGRG
ncbi:MAG: hypothetical protein D6788_05865 [Planctomycetota bacterium]|nr:MAG: hypothetical protein D6788_05865 [Planctomycetota bacterium]